MKKKITYIISNIDKALAFEWIAEKIDPLKYELSFVLLNPGPSELHNFLVAKGIPVRTIIYRGKKDLPKALLQTFLFLKKQRSDIVHCHLFEGSLVGLLAARLAGIKTRIYTRHHSSYHHVYFPKAVKYDKLINRLSTHIVAVSQPVADILIKQEDTASSKVSVIHHGFDLSAFEPSVEEKTRMVKKYNPHNQYPVIGIVSRFTEWKGLQYSLPAFKKLLQEYPNALLLLFNAIGSYETEVRKILKEMPEQNFQVIVFEKDLPSVYSIFDVFVHVPIDRDSEAFGQVYVEALAAGVPSVFTCSGIATEIIRPGENALVTNFCDTDSILQAVKHILSDEVLRQTLTTNALRSISNHFSVEKMIFNLEELYDRA